jgi:rhamnulokinase
MWMIKQCLDHWDAQGRSIDLPALIGKAGKLESPPAILNVDAPELMLAGEMPSRINRELVAHGNVPIPDIPGNEAIFARLIFSSLASRYAVVVKNLQEFTGRNFRQITILGGGSRNTLLTRLTEEATGLPVICGEAEGSTLGNFAVQLAVSDPEHSPGHPPSPKLIRKWAEFLTQKPVAVP